MSIAKMKARGAKTLAGLGVLVASLSSSGAGAAPDDGAPTGTVTEYGIYGAGDGKPVLERRTARIPARRGLRFGFCAELRGLNAVEGKATLSEMVRHPLLTQPNGIETNGWNAPHLVRVDNGVARWCGGHRFAHEWELVPGTWRFVLGEGAQDLVVQEFQVVPDGE
jgi:hypothetical protein